MDNLYANGKAWAVLADLAAHIEEEQEDLAFLIEIAATKVVGSGISCELIGADDMCCTFLVNDQGISSDREIIWELLEAAN